LARAVRWFSDAEVNGLNPRLVEMLEDARTRAKVPFEITSGYRPGDDKSHGRALAVDLRCSTSYRRMRIVSAALLAGFRRIGVYDLHVHLDIDKKLPQDVMWWGESK
jgi:hypothetical protein